MFRTLKYTASLATALASTALIAGDTSATQPEGFADLTTAEASKSFSVVKPTSTAWLAYNNGEYYLDYTHAFDNGGKYDRTDRCIINASAADFGYSFDEPTVVTGYKIYLPKDDGISPNDRAPGKWTFEGSDDKSSWTVLDTRGETELENGWGANADGPVARFYTFTNKTSYRHYRLNVTGTAKSDAGYLQLSEIEFFNTNPKELDLSVFANHQGIKVAGMDDGVTLAKLPVLLRLDPSAMTFGRADHADLAFTQGTDNAPLLYEVDTWTETSALVWVCLDTASRGATFTMHWGADVDVASDFRYDWQDYAAVVHFNGEERDTAKYERVASSLKTGFVGGGVSGAKTKIKSPFGALSDQSKFAVSVWVDPTANGSTVRIASTKADYGHDGMELIYVKDTGIYLRGNKSDKQIVYKDSNDTVFPKNTWTHYLAVCNGMTGSIYKNGAAMSVAGEINSASTSGKDLMMGGYNVTEEGKGNDANLAGTMDELRIYNGIPSAARVKAEYQAMSDAGFLTTETIPSTVEVTSIVSAVDEAKVTIAGNVQLGEKEDKVTVVIGVGTTEAANDRTYEIADCVTGAFSKEITDLAAGRYYFSVSLKGIAGSASVPLLLRVGVLPVVEWTGAGNGTSWTDPGNWNSGTVPLADDCVLFGSRVSGPMTVVPGDGEAKAKKITITTPYALRLENVGALDVEIAESAAEENVISPMDLNLMDGTDVGTWSVPEGKTLKIGNLIGRASLVKTGAGTVNLAGQQCDRAVGTTEVREGTLIFTANRQLGTALSVGGGEIPAVAKAESAAGNFNPFDANKRPVHVLRNGLLDLSSDGSSGQHWIGQSLVGQFTVDAGGTLDLGQRRYAYAGMDQDLIINGTLISENAYRLDLEYGAVTVGETAEKPVTIDCPVYIQYQYAHNRACYATFEAAAGKMLTVNGVITPNWDPRDGIDKKGEGVVRLTKGNRYGGGSNDAQGRTTVYAGTLLVDNTSGSGTGYSRVHVNGGATLGGTGTIGGVNTEFLSQSKVVEKGDYVRLVVAGSETAPATVWPGTIDDATGQHINGVLTVGSSVLSHPVTFGAHSTLKLTFGKTVVSDALVVNGTVAIGETDTKLVLEPNCDLKDLHGGTFTVLSATGGITGDFSEIVAPKGWHVNKVMGKVMTEEGEVDTTVAVTVSMAGRGLTIIIR